VLYHTETCFGVGGSDCIGDPNGGAGAGSQLFTVSENVTVSVPEPSTWALMLIGFAGQGFVFRQSRRKMSFA
jgi:PEP-CTERM motif